MIHYSFFVMIHLLPFYYSLDFSYLNSSFGDIVYFYNHSSQFKICQLFYSVAVLIYSALYLFFCKSNTAFFKLVDKKSFISTSPPFYISSFCCLYHAVNFLGIFVLFLNLLLHFLLFVLYQIVQMMMTTQHLVMMMVQQSMPMITTMTIKMGQFQ